MRRLSIAMFFLAVIACKPDMGQQGDSISRDVAPYDSLTSTPSEVKTGLDYDTSQWMELTARSGVRLDMRYAKADNFTGEVIYSCGRCFMRPDAGKRLLRLQGDIAERYGWRLLVFDCYRPRTAQQRLWDAVPDPTYVTPPDQGSMHNRGLAIDLGLVDESGRPMDMGSDFDSFGRESHTDYLGHSDEVLRNRRILRKLMELHGFRGIRTEWWHFSLRNVQADLSSWEWSCDL